MLTSSPGISAGRLGGQLASCIRAFVLQCIRVFSWYVSQLLERTQKTLQIS